MFFFFSSRRRHTRCALVTGVQTCALPISLAEWREVMDVNLNAAFVCSTEAARHMRDGGAIVNLASIMGVSGGGAYPIASYHASKGGLINLTRALAVEWAHMNIRVNAIAPRSEEHTSELQSLMRTSYAVFCLKKNKTLTHLNQ